MTHKQFVDAITEDRKPETCDNCNGKGTEYDETCVVCGGEGVMRDDEGGEG